MSVGGGGSPGAGVGEVQGGALHVDPLIQARKAWVPSEGSLGAGGACVCGSE